MHMRGLPRLILPALLLSACGKTEPPAEQAAAAPPPAPNLVHVTATDYAFQAPDTLPSGVTTFHLMNEGRSPARGAGQARVCRFPEGEPGRSASTRSRGAGRSQCRAPGRHRRGDGGPHPRQLYRGVSHSGRRWQAAPDEGNGAALVVTQGSSTAAMPVADITVKLSDYAFEVTGPLTAGRHVIGVEDAGPQMHELIFVKLEPGKTVQRWWPGWKARGTSRRAHWSTARRR